MGLYDEVDFDFNCPNCGDHMTFQTKDTDCVLTTVSPAACTNFYGSCNYCGTWLEFNRVNPPTIVFEYEYDGEKKEVFLSGTIKEPEVKKIEIDWKVNK